METVAMLEAMSVEVPLGVAEVAAVIEACATAAQACTSCADACLAEDELAALRACIALDNHCADICAVTARVLSRPGRFDQLVVDHLLRACVIACASCAEECARHAEHHRHCAICAKLCRACEQACTALLEAEAFTELQKLAGG
jgi:hypothetical protein